MIKISLVLPTRGRPKLVKRFFDSVFESTSNINAVEIILIVDDDDVESHTLDDSRLKIIRIVTPRLSMGEYNMAGLKASSGDIIMLVNDDMIMGSKGWDEALRKVHKNFDDGVYLCYGNDGFKGKKLPTFPILSRVCCSLLDQPYPAIYRGAFIDYHLFDIFKRLNKLGINRIVYLDDVSFEHCHFRNGKADVDETYLSRGRFDDDAPFLQLANYRQEAAVYLSSTVKNLSSNQLQENIVKPAIIPSQIKQPKNLLGALVLYLKIFLFDKGLPLGWRAWLLIWFYGRYLASNGWLRPFVRN